MALGRKFAPPVVVSNMSSVGPAKAEFFCLRVAARGPGTRSTCLKIHSAGSCEGGTPRKVRMHLMGELQLFRESSSGEARQAGSGSSM